MKRVLNYLLIALVCLSSAACTSSITKKMQAAKDVVVSCNPEILTVQGGEVAADVTVSFPKGYFHPKAIVAATPVIVTSDGEEICGTTYKYQGEKVKDNFKVISKEGTSVTESISFPFVSGMEKCVLQLRTQLIYAGIDYDMPIYKIAEGCNTTGADAVAGAAYSFKADGYQPIIYNVTEGQIHYEVNSASVSKNQLKNESIKEMLGELEDLKADERVTVTGTEIIAYASPEGGQKLNAELSDRRAASAKKAWDGLKTGVSSSDPSIQSVGQDWDGFAEAVQNSNISDKDLILRVLSMYSDPAVREKEIRNIAQIFTQLKKDVLPELRRARFITNSEYKNYTDEELEEIAKTSLANLDATAILHLASLADDIKTKTTLTKVAYDKFGSQTALYNLACCNLEQGNVAQAKALADKIKDQNDKDVVNLQGVIKLINGDIEGAKANFQKCGNVENLGTVDLVNGDYAAAVSKLANTNSSNKAVAYILNGQYDKAKAALTGDDAQTYYYRAVVAARQGRTSEVEGNLKKAFEKDPSLKAKAEKDIEFAKCR